MKRLVPLQRDEAFRVSDRTRVYFIALTKRVRLDLLLAAVLG